MDLAAAWSVNYYYQWASIVIVIKSGEWFTGIVLAYCKKLFRSLLRDPIAGATILPRKEKTEHITASSYDVAQKFKLMKSSTT